MDSVETRLTKLENELKSLSSLVSSKSTDVLSGAKTKDGIDAITAESIHRTLWEEVFYISSFATASITTTTTELLDANGRESDTTGGKIFRPERESKFKTSFYLNDGFDISTVYITSPAISTSASIGTSITDDEKSYVGIKIVNGTIYLVSGKSGHEMTKTTTATITDTTTHVLEIDYYVGYADIYFNNASIGNIPCNLTENATFATFFPFLTSVGSSDATDANLTMESYEFLQKRN